MNNIKLTWHGHSCFSLEYSNYILVMDPYKHHTVPGLPNLRLRANQVICSHKHHDHCAIDVVEHTISKYPSPFDIQYIDSFHDKEHGNLRGSNRISIIQCQNMKFVHFGDQGCLPTSEQMALLQNADVVMIPVGGFYTIDAHDAKQIVDQISPKVIIPMHYRSDSFGYAQIEKVDPFVQLFPLVHHYPSNTIMIHPKLENQVALLQLNYNEKY